MASVVSSRHLLASDLAVAFLTALALFGGWLVRETAVSPRVVEQRGISMEIPVGWAYEVGEGELVLAARDPVRPAQGVRVRTLSAHTGASLAAVAAAVDAGRSRILDNYAMLDAAPADVAGVDAYRVRYCFTGPVDVAPVVLMEGIEYLLRADGKDGILAVGLEADAHETPALEHRLDRLLESAAASWLSDR